MRLTDPADVAAQYATTDNLETRRSVWGPGPDGTSPVDVVREQVVARRPCQVLEIGCGTGAFARSVIEALAGVEYVATDAAPSMVAAARTLGVPAQCVDAQSLPFDDDSFDVVVAAWMLYHVGDLDVTLAEVRRVLRPGGTFVAATNGDRHLAGLLRDAGGAPIRLQFSSENGVPSLGRHFDVVSRRDIMTWAAFADHAATTAYLQTFAPDLARALPPFAGSRRYDGFATVFTAH